MNTMREREEKWKREKEEMRCIIENFEKKIGKLEEERERKEKERESPPGEERIKRMEKIMEREERKKRKENIIIKRVSEEDTMEDVRKIRKKIGVEMDIEEDMIGVEMDID